MKRRKPRGTCPACGGLPVACYAIFREGRGVDWDIYIARCRKGRLWRGIYRLRSLEETFCPFCDESYYDHRCTDTPADVLKLAEKRISH